MPVATANVVIAAGRHRRQGRGYSGANNDTIEIELSCAIAINRGSDVIPLVEGNLHRWIDVNGGGTAAIDHLKEKITGVIGKTHHDVVVAWPIAQIKDARPSRMTLEVDPGFKG